MILSNAIYTMTCFFV